MSISGTAHRFTMGREGLKELPPPYLKSVKIHKKIQAIYESDDNSS